MGGRIREAPKGGASLMGQRDNSTLIYHPPWQKQRGPAGGVYIKKRGQGREGDKKEEREMGN